MRRRTVAFEQARRAQHQRSCADRGDVLGAHGLLAQKSQHLLVIDHVIGAEPAGHANDVELRAVGESHRRRQRHHGVAGDRFDPFPDQMHLGARHAGKHLQRTGEVELGNPGEQHKTDLQRRGHEGLLI